MASTLSLEDFAADLLRVPAAVAGSGQAGRKSHDDGTCTGPTQHCSSCQCKVTHVQ